MRALTLLIAGVVTLGAADTAVRVRAHGTLKVPLVADLTPGGAWPAGAKLALGEAARRLDFGYGAVELRFCRDRERLCIRLVGTRRAIDEARRENAAPNLGTVGFDVDADRTTGYRVVAAEGQPPYPQAWVGTEYLLDVQGGAITGPATPKHPVVNVAAWHLDAAGAYRFGQERLAGRMQSDRGATIVAVVADGAQIALPLADTPLAGHDRLRVAYALPPDDDDVVEVHEAVLDLRD